MRRVIVVMVAAGLGIAILATSAPSARAIAGATLGYSIREARATAVKGSLSKEVIENLPSSCDPKTDPYQCDTSKYEHKPNCPASLAYGARKRAPQPAAGIASPQPSGGAGDEAGPSKSPDQSSPVRLNRLLALGRLTHLGAVEEAGGLASHIYVDLSGRLTPTAHTESEAFSNRPDIEERCYPQNDNGGIDTTNYEHFLSRSGEEPQTYHLAECFGSECTFGLGAGAQEARTIVHLVESSGTVQASLEASFQDLRLASGVLAIDSLVTFVNLRSDGTARGLSWTAMTRASGARLAGRPIALPPGQTVQAQGISFGIAEPFVQASPEGQSIRIVAPGLFFGSAQQSVFFGDAELDATLGLFAPAPFVFTPPFRTPPRTIHFPSRQYALPPQTQQVRAAPPVVTAAPKIRELTTGELIVPVILGLGGAVLLSLASRWIRRFSWGRRLYRYQPFRGLDWLYRAFLKT